MIVNINLSNITRRIIAEQGELILSDPQRLKGYISDYAKNEPAACRLAFGRCIEYGAYSVLKSATDRSATKAALARKVHDSEGLDIALCIDALDALEAALFSAQPAQTQPVYQSKNDNTPYSDTIPTAAQKISKKTYVFGFAAGLGALAGELVSDILRLNDGYGTHSAAFLIANTALWAALLGLGISAGLLIVQNHSTKKRPDVAQIIKTALIGIIVGSAAGGGAQLIFGFTANISTAIEIISRVLCWGLLGFGIGWGASFYIPNYPAARAMLAGLLGGAVGGAVFRALFVIPEPFNRILGVMILGAFIGFSISFIEEALREAWLTVIWAQNEATTVSLGEKPLSFGSSREAGVYLPRRPSDPPAPPIRAIFYIENDKVIMEDRLSGGRNEFQNEAQVDLGRVHVIVHTKK
jgi:hypothetical protein